LIVLMIEL